MNQSKQMFGSSIKRIEDGPLLRGTGRFVDDIVLPGMLEAAFVRSPHSHALINSIDKSSAMAAPGVHAVYTYSDLRPHLRGDRIILGLPSPSYRLGIGRRLMGSTEVVHVGEAVAVVVASNRYLAEDAAALVHIDYDILPAVSDCKASIEPGSPMVHSDLPHNLAAEFDIHYGDIDKQFDSATHVFHETLCAHRGVAQSMECRGMIGFHDRLDDLLTLWTSTQSPHGTMRVLADLLGREEECIRVIAPDVGGGFGTKVNTYPEEVIIALTSILLGRPVKWIEDRREHFLTSTQERDQIWDVEIAVDTEGKILGLRGTLIHDQGAYTARGVNVAYASSITMPLPYNVPAYHLGVKLSLTNKVPVTALRGAGQPQAAFAMERLLDRVARELKIDRAEVRRRNQVQAKQMPCTKPLKVRGGTAIVLDSGDYPATQTDAMNRGNWFEFKKRQSDALKEGRYIGIGLANYVEGTGRGPFEPTTVRIGRSGIIQVTSSATAMGQGTKTMLAQVVSQQLGCDINNVTITTGDTAKSYLGFGGFNSRQAVMAGASAHAAALRVRAKALAAAAAMLEVPIEELEIVATTVVVKGRNLGLTLGEVARALEGVPGYPLPGGLDAGLEATERVIINDMTFSHGTAIVEVEVDADTGAVAVKKIILAHDCGRMINPMLVEGQILGGLAHGLGNALYEWMCFDENAQPVTVNLGEYLLVTAPEMPTVELSHHESPSLLNVLGVKGVGESGVIPIPAAVISAVEDALSPFDVRISHFPISPHQLVKAIEAAKSRN